MDTEEKSTAELLNAFLTRQKQLKALEAVFSAEGDCDIELNCFGRHLQVKRDNTTKTIVFREVEAV